MILDGEDITKQTDSLSSSKPATLLRFQKLVGVILGSLFLSLMSQVMITLPVTPIPISLQTLAIALLAFTMGTPAIFSVILYWVQILIGLPVLAGGRAEPLWFIKPSAGYIFSFVLSAYVIARIYAGDRPFSLIRSTLALVLGHAVILLVGFGWLAGFVGISEAYRIGVAPFFFGAMVKIVMALGLIKPINYGKRLIDRLN